MLDSEEERKKRENGQENFAFPVLPYSIQVNLMETLFNSLSDKLLIVESPTGTVRFYFIILINHLITDYNLLDTYKIIFLHGLLYFRVNH